MGLRARTRWSLTFLVFLVAFPVTAAEATRFATGAAEALESPVLVAPGPTSTLQPGAVVQTPTGLCSFNFLFRGGDGQRYMGTAGHCILADSGERSWARGSGPVARDGLGRRVGEFAYAVLGSSGDLDFALVRLDDNVRPVPQLPAFGGPSGVNEERVSTPVLLHYCGSGIGVGTLVSCRSGVALSMSDPRLLYMEGVATPGDSGAPVVSSDRRAVGLIVAVGLNLGSIGDGGIDAGVLVLRLGRQLQRAERTLNVDLALVTSPAS